MDKGAHDPHVAVTSLRDSGAVQQGTVVVYQPPRSTAVWGHSIPQPLTPSSPFAGGTCTGGRMLRIRRKLFFPRS